MNKNETRVAMLEAARTPPNALMLRRFAHLLHRAEHLPAAVFTARLDAFMDACNDDELLTLIEHLDNEVKS